MILKLKTLFLSLSMLGVNAKHSQVMTASGRDRREARRVERSLPKIQAGEHGQEGSCREHGTFCWDDSQCCDEMECLGIGGWACGYTPGREDEFCNLLYPCDSDLLCYEGSCTDYADILDYGESEGTCAEGSPSGELKIMTYNTFLIQCLTGFGGGWDIACQDYDAQSERIARMMQWVQTRDEDVIVFQELWTHRHQVTQGMIAAGFCHYVVTPFGADGDGTAIFSKHPIGEIDFWDFYDTAGANSLGPPSREDLFLFDRGIIYAEILKDGLHHHVYNTHTLSDSNGDMHLRRLSEYMLMKEVASGKSASDSVFFAGDMNENKYNEHVGDEYYEAMLQELDAFEPVMVGANDFTYDNVNNPLPAIYYPPEEKIYQELLDYVLYSKQHLEPSQSQCEILNPVWPPECGNDVECQVSDHYPVTCTYSFPQDASMEPVATE